VRLSPSILCTLLEYRYRPLAFACVWALAFRAMLEVWISAVEAFKLVEAATNPYQAQRAICSRANDGLIEARAVMLFVDGVPHNEAVVPKEFWWARGEPALKQNWTTGDFETWIERRHLKAYGVSFSRSGIEALIGPASAASAVSPDPPTNVGGRPAAAWWDDLWIEICRQLWTGELLPKKQSDIESAMMSWASTRGHDPAESTIRIRARKLWTALNREDEN
jgi:hypothetical protein